MLRTHNLFIIIEIITKFTNNKVKLMEHLN